MKIHIFIKKRFVNMLEAKISVEQHQCSLATVTKEKGLELEIMSHIPLSEDRILFLVQEKKRESATPRYLKEIEGHESTKSFEVIQISPEKTLFMAAIDDASAIHAFEEAHCFIKHPILIKNGKKYYTIHVTDLKNLNRAYDKLKKLGKWSIDEVYNLDKETSGDNLTPMQRKILLTAKGMGYFDEGHTVTIEDIGKALGISKSTAHHHLKEAKKKLVFKYISEHQENQMREGL